MKKIIIFLLLITPILSTAQNKLFINTEIGGTTLYHYGSPIGSSLEISRLNGLILWEAGAELASTIGISYETKSVNFFGDNYHLVTDLNLSHRGYNDREHVNYILLSNNIYFPKKEKDKRFRMLVGVRNSLVVKNFGEGDPLLYFPRYIFGGALLLNYAVTPKFNIGVSTYFDFSGLAITKLGSKFLTAEIMLKLSYRIK